MAESSHRRRRLREKEEDLRRVVAGVLAREAEDTTLPFEFEVRSEEPHQRSCEGSPIV